MRAAWYDRPGPAAEVLQVGHLPQIEPGPGEVRVRLALSGISPGDVKKRSAWTGAPLPFPRVVPHSDGAGVIDAVGDGVDRQRLGRRAWVFGAQSYRAFGTAAQSTVVPEALAVDLPDTVADEIGASLGIPGVTAHRAVFADGPVAGRTVLVQGVRGGVGSLAAQLARWAGATVIGTVRTTADLPAVERFGLAAVVPLDHGDPVGAIRDAAPDGVDRVVEVALSDNAALDAQVVRNGATVAAYASRAGLPGDDFWNLLFLNVLVRLLGSDDFPAAAKAEAAHDLTQAAAAGALTVAVADVLPLAQIARAHDLVESGRSGGRVLLRVDR